MKHAIVLAGVLVLAACSTAPEPMAPPSPTPAAPPPPASAAPQPAADSCGARAMQHLVGRPRTEIPVPVRPEQQRVACTTCAVTLDFSPNRLNFFFDAQTGLIKEIRCG